MSNIPKQKEKAVSFIAYFIGGFTIGLLISLIGGCFHNAPKIMWKEIIILSSTIGLLTGLWGDKFLDRLFKILKYF